MEALCWFYIQHMTLGVSKKYRVSLHNYEAEILRTMMVYSTRLTNVRPHYEDRYRVTWTHLFSFLLIKAGCMTTIHNYHLSVRFSLCVSASLYLSSCLCLSVFRSLCLCLSVSLSVCLFLFLCFSLSFILCLSVCLPLCLSVRPSCL